MPCFIIGIVVYNAKMEDRRFIAILGFQLFVFATKFCEWSGYIAQAIQFSKLFIVSSIFASVVLLSNEISAYNKNITKVLDYLDEHSYTLYLVHGITFCGILDKDIFSKQIFYIFGNDVAVIIFRLFISVIVTSILTVIIHKYFEKPIQKKLNKWIV